MTKNWILVAHRTGARLFENLGPGSGLSKVEEFMHPGGHLKNQDIATDDGGRSYDSAGGARHRMEQKESPKHQEDRHFAHELAQALKKGHEKNHYTRLFLVAEPKFLGEIKGELDKKSLSLLEATLDKDLVHVEDRDVAGHLSTMLKL